MVSMKRVTIGMGEGNLIQHSNDSSDFAFCEVAYM